MKFLIVNTDYPEYIKWLYKTYPGLDSQPFSEQARARMETFAGTANFFSSNLQKLGYEAWDVIANLEPAQKQWAYEQGMDYNEKRWHIGFRRGVLPWLYRHSGWIGDILAAQVKAYNPDVIYSMALETVGSDFLRRVRGYYRLAVGQHAAPLTLRPIDKYDLILSSLPNQVDYFRNQGMPSETFRLGFEPKVLAKLSGTEKKPYDIVFIGGLSGPHRQGVPILDALSQKFEVNVWGYGVDKLPSDSFIRRSYRGPVWGLEMYQILQNAKIVFNRHIDVAGAYANNLRLYEATGVGTLLLTDHKQNLSDMFEPMKEVAVYQNLDECLALAGYYLGHDKDRQELAFAGQQRTLNEHTWFHRMQELAEIVHRYL